MTTPDRFPGASIEDDEIILVANATGPTTPGAFNYDGTSFVMRDSIGNFNPRASATDIAYVVLTVAGTLVYTGDGDLTMKV